MILKKMGFLIEVENLYDTLKKLQEKKLSHIIFATIFGKKIKKIKLSLAGICVTFSNEYLSVIKRIIMYLVGPISNFVLALIFNNINFIYEVNLFLGILNLLPIYPLDGYNILLAILDLVNKSNYINFIERVFISSLLFISISIFLLYFNPSLLIFVTYILLIKNISKNHGKIR